MIRLSGRAPVPECRHPSAQNASADERNEYDNLRTGRWLRDANLAEPAPGETVRFINDIYKRDARILDALNAPFAAGEDARFKRI
ncbi:MAG: hypothetical protein QNJ82_11075 [Gammaproteobacteria bacterium]|nr:hypothetical protein [Gammaproteobacteria bacterium]